MNPIITLLKEHDISDEKIHTLFQTLTDNPIMAMSVLGELGLPPEKLQAVLMQVMQQPDLIKDAVETLGLDFAQVEAAKSKLQDK